MLSLRLHGLTLVLLVLNIVSVVMLFRLVPDRQLAGYIAGTLFVLMGLWVTISEFKMGRGLRSVSFWAGLVFLVFSALPILGIRALNPGVPFDELSVFGVPGPQLHVISNGTFMLMITATIIEIIRDVVARRSINPL